MNIAQSDITADPRMNEFIAANIPFLGPDEEIMRDHRMRPRSEREERVLSQGGNEYLFVEIRRMLQGTLDDNYEITENMIVAPAARFGDLTTAIFTGAGDHAMASTKGVIGFCSCIHYPIRFVNKYYAHDPAVGVYEGDCFQFNDPFYGGMHPPDHSSFMPVFYEGELIAWVCCGLHQGEDGAKEPGGMGPAMESPYDEGLKMPPIKVAEKYRVRTDMLTFLQNSTRDPRMLGADIKTRFATCQRIEEALHRAIGIYGVDAVVGALRQNIEYVADEVKRRIAELPEGTIRTNAYLDSTMREDVLLRMPLTMTIRDGRMILDFRGCAPQLGNRPINAPQTSMKVLLSMCYLCFVWPDLPRVNAVLDPIEFITDRNSICDASRDVPTALNMQVFFKGITLAHLAMAKLYYPTRPKYGKVIAPWFNQAVTFIYGGITQNFEMVGNLCADLNGMPGGAHWDDDGEHSITPNFAAMTDCGESEITELELPFMQLISKSFATDNLGFGKYRSGAGYQTSAAMRGSPLWGFSAIAGGSKFSSVPGLFGGYGSPAYPVCKIKNVNIFRELEKDPSLFKSDMATLMNTRPFDGAVYTSNRAAIPFELCEEGELYMMSQGAGGGYGDVLERDPERVIKDIEEGLVSREIARSLFFVRFDDRTLAIDHAGTEQARADERKARIARGIRFHEFVKSWVRTEPPANIPYFGSWGDDISVVYANGVASPADAVPRVMMADPRDVKVARLEAELAALREQPTAQS
ncbi:hydantoinase B/oxoprolinase family protein [Novosphingobium sp.]|uniref:hydantoinase B/oxoprolinase family protein n=1 Tax=Novosphingobium sp. TaxID=1874826 RepID=UPI0038BD08B9